MGKAKDYDCYLGGFDYEWKNPPARFNPQFDPFAVNRNKKVSQSMEADHFYSGHTREECRIEWRRRYDQLKQQDQNNG
jgi:hypothetical protein